MNKAAYFFSYLLIVCSIDSGAGQNNTQISQFWLVQTWPYGFCSVTTCRGGLNLTPDFINHGLWPVNSDGQTISSKKNLPFNISDIKSDQSIYNNMKTYWYGLVLDDETFWKHEWDSHGISQNLFRVASYFKVGLYKRQQTNLLQTFKDKGIEANGNSYPKANYLTAIQAVTGNHTPVLKCVYKNNIHLLYEVIICLDSLARYFNVSCNSAAGTYGYNCGRNIKFPSQVEQ